MNPFQHPACNSTLAPPAGMTEEQCRTLHIYREVLPGQPPYVGSFWKPEPQELEALNEGGSIWVRMMGHTHPPFSLLVSPAPDAAGAIETNPPDPEASTPPEPAFVLTSDHFLALVKERDELLAWRNQEFDSGDDSLFNVRRLRAYLKRSQDASASSAHRLADFQRHHAAAYDFIRLLHYAVEKCENVAELGDVLALNSPVRARLSELHGQQGKLPNPSITTVGDEDIPIGICEPLPLSGFPEGQTRIRMRGPDDVVHVVVRTPQGIRQFIPAARDGHWVPLVEIGRNTRDPLSNHEIPENAEVNRLKEESDGLRQSMIDALAGMQGEGWDIAMPGFGQREIYDKLQSAIPLRSHKEEALSGLKEGT